METKELKFKRDTQLRKQSFVPDSFAHPAKMDAQLLIRIVEEYTKPGEVILDPMAGSGTMMLACGLGRHCILGELEGKFIKMCSDNLEKVRMNPQLGYQMGDCKIIQGDARQLEGLLVDKVLMSPPHGNRLSDAEVKDGDPQRMSYRQALGKVDKCIFSPPFGEVTHHSDEPSHQEKFRPGRTGTCAGTAGDSKDNIGNLPYGQIDKIVTSPPYTETLQRWGKSETDLMAKKGLHQESRNSIGNLPYGNIDSIITSPPYEGTDVCQTHTTSKRNATPGHPSYRPSWKTKFAGGFLESKRPYHEVDSIITSPPYEEAMGKKHHSPRADKLAKEKSNPVTYTDKVDNIITSPPYEEGGQGQGKEYHPERMVGPETGLGRGYGGDAGNIGNLKSESYLVAMLQVYQRCHKVLKLGGLMILVTKNFIRNKQVVRLDLDTIKLCEQTGFILLERLYRKLQAQSFWRVIYHQKYPEVETIDYEDILVFRKDQL